MAAGSRTLKLSILGDVDNLNKSLKSATGDVETFGDKMSKVGKIAGAALAAAAVAAAGFAIKIGVESVKAASDLSETISKVGVLFGDTSKEIENFAAEAASSLGQTKQQALDAAATFATFGKAAGLTGTDLSKFSIDFVKLSSDLASFNNTSPEQAINAIGSALRGEAEPLRAYGVLLDDASLRQAALELGIINTTKNALTPQQKVLAAQALIYKQTGAAQGDFERTSDGLANKTRILTAQLENAKTTIGTALLPVVLELATVFSTTVLPVIENVATAFSDSQGNFGGYIRQIGTFIQNTFTPILNGLIKAFGYVREAIGDNLKTFTEFGGYIATYLAPIIGNVLGAALQTVGKIAAGVINIVGDVVGAINRVINTAIDGINFLIRAYNAIPFIGGNVNQLGQLSLSGSNAGATPGGAGGGGGFTGGSTGGGFSGGGGVGGGVGGGIGGSATAAKSLTDLVGKLTGVSDSLTELTFKVATGGVSKSAGQKELNALVKQFDVLNKQAEAVTRGVGTATTSNNLTGFNPMQGGNTINLTVNGAIDKEGTARSIVDTLNNSFFRGGGGGANALVMP
jgi:uncharacterized membrane protein YgcG